MRARRPREIGEPQDPVQHQRADTYRVGIGADQGQGFAGGQFQRSQPGVGERLPAGHQLPVSRHSLAFPDGDGGHGGEVGQVSRAH